MFHTNTKNGITYLTADTLCGVCHAFPPVQAAFPPRRGTV